MKIKLRSIVMGTSLILSSIFMAGNATSQNVHKDFIDGEIWFQLRADKFVHQMISRDGDVKPDLNNMKLSSMPYLRDVFTAHSVTRLNQPWPRAYGSDALMSTYHIEFDDVKNVDQFISELEESGAVVFAEKVPHMTIAVVPNDPLHASQMWGLTKIDAENAWNVGTGSSSIIVATTDNAIQITHPDLANVLWVNTGEIPNNGVDDDNNGYIDDVNGFDVGDNDNNPNPLTNSWDHGTHVAGTTGAETNNNQGVSSIGFGISIMAVKSTKNSSGSNSVNNGYDGIYYSALNGADIINCSWGGTGFSTSGQNMVNWATGQGSIVVAAAGNSNVDNDVTPHYPSNYSNAVAVAATTTNDAKASFSCYGANSVDIAAPGTFIHSTVPTNNYADMQGTSMACPMVSGLLGLMKSLNPNMPNNDLLNCLYSTADNIDGVNPSYIGELGAGRINALAAMNCVGATLSSAPNALFTVNFTTITAGGSVTFTDQSTFGPTQWAWRFDNQNLGGVSPATAITQGPHIVTYNTPGVYEVRLTATNANGSDVETKTAYITVTTPGSCNEPNLDDNTFSSTAGIHVGWTSRLYGATAGGYLSGNNAYTLPAPQDAKAEYFPSGIIGSNAQFVEGVYIWIGVATNATNPTFEVNVWDATGGAPTGAPLATRTLNLADYVTQGSIYYWRFTTPVPLPASSEIAVGVDFSNLNIAAGDTLAVVTNTFNTNASTTTGYEKLTNGTWQDYTVQWTGVTSLSHYIFPVLTADPATISLSASPTTICEGELVTYDASGSTYQDTLLWSFPGVTPNQSINIIDSVIYSSPGTYRTYLQVVGGGCNTYRIDSVDITVNPTPTINISATADTICSGSSVTLTASGGGTYNWTPGGAGTSISPSPTVNSAYSVSSTVAGCFGQASKTIYVDVAPTAVATHTPSGNICSGRDVYFDGSASTGGNSLDWSFPAGSPASPTATGGFPAMNFGAAGTHPYSLTVTNTCGSAVDNGSLTVILSPVVTASASPATTICAGDTVTLTAIGADTYSWTNSVVNGVPFVPGATTTYIATGTNTTTGCPDTAHVTITVDPCTGIGDPISNAGYSIYPNPTSNVLNIDGLANAKQLTLIDVTGKIIYNTTELNENTLKIDMTNASKGLYFIQVETTSGIESFKVVKQ